MTDLPGDNSTPQDNQSYVDSYQPPTNTQPAQPAAEAPTSPPAQQPTTPAQPAAATPDPAPTSNSAAESGDESIESQNIFFLMGAEGTPDDAKERYLDELQQIIWEDFIEKDVELLLTQAEMAGLKQIMEKGESPEVQEEMVVYLEEIIPELDKLMLEKALNLKADMVRERVAGLKEYYAGNDDAQQKLQEADGLVKQSKWRSATLIMNSIPR